MFEVKNLQYKDIIRLEALTFAPQRSTAISGASGGGKTTLLRLLDGIVLPDAGSVWYGGQEIRALHDLRRRVCMVPQTPVLYEGNVRENLEIGFVLCAQPKPSADFLKGMLELCCLNVPLEAETKMLSGGEQARLALARAFALERETYLLDEPTGALDVQTQETVIGHILSWMKEGGRTLITVTHSEKLAERCDAQLRVTEGGAFEWVR